MALKPITRKEQIIAGKELEPITRMEKFLKEYGGGSDGEAISWNDLTDRPFYEEVTETTAPLDLSWDGNLSGREWYGSGKLVFCKVSDAILTLEDLSAGTVVIYDLSEGATFQGVIGADILPVDAQDELGVAGVFLVFNDFPFVLSVSETITFYEIITLPPGTYFIGELEAEGATTALIYTSNLSNPDAMVTVRTEVVKKLDNKYLDLDWIPKETVELLYSGTLEYSGSPVFGLSALGLAVGDTIEVTIDGETVRDVAAAGDGGSVALTETTESGLVFTWVEGQAVGGVAFTFSANGTYSVEIKRVATSPLPDKFLPNALGAPIFDLREYGLGALGNDGTTVSVSDTDVNVIAAELEKGPVFLTYDTDDTNGGGTRTTLVVPCYVSSNLSRRASGFDKYDDGLHWVEFSFGSTSFTARRTLVIPSTGVGIVVKSSTSGSTKQFKITVDDSGTISATEV